jgi:hypothetical protein
MHQTAPLALAAQSRSTRASRQRAASSMAAPAVGAKPSSTRLALRVAAALAGSLILIIALVDPLRGNHRLEADTAAHHQGVRHG